MCGNARTPLEVALRLDGATWRQVEQDQVIAALQRVIAASLIYREPTMVGEVERYQLGATDQMQHILRRVENCSQEGSRGAQRCDTAYILDVRPSDEVGPALDCRAP
ncbi:MAG: hypothetical protein KDA35_07820 [Hyphomonadaceae bacterium]|nr:hypothetical protein [Hyphomonadaceae bacterium]